MQDFTVESVVETPRYSVVRNKPNNPTDPVWFTVRLRPHFTLADLDAVRQYLPENGEDVSAEWITADSEEGDWYVDFTLNADQINAAA